MFKRRLTHIPPAEEERARRRGHTGHVTNSISPRSSNSDVTTVVNDTAVSTISVVSTASDMADGTAPSVDADPPVNTNPPVNTVSPVGVAPLLDIPTPVEVVPPSVTVSEEGYHLLSSSPAAIELQPDPAPTHDNKGQGTPSPSPLVTPQQLPLDDTPTTTPSTPTADDAVTTPGHSEDPVTIPAPLKVFTFEGTSNFITSSAIDYWEKIPGGQGWIAMVNAYLRLESLPIPPGVRVLSVFLNYVLMLPQCPLRLPTESRPTELSTWMKGRSFSADRLPFVPNTGAFGRSWVTWWTACQPAWRRNEGWPLPKARGSSTTWGKLAARGQNGMFIVVMSIALWAASLTPTDDRGVFDEAVDDIRWVFDQILDAPGAAGVVQDPTPPQETQNTASMASWQARGDGKRQSRASRKLLEALS